jgi:DNA-binding NarL/FixJ family response regulator
VAAAIPNARLIAIDGSNLGDLDQGLRAIEEFLAGLPAKEDAPALRAGPHAGTLSAREVDVLKLIAAGKSNAQIADELVISQNTAIRHVSNIFAKIGAANRAEAAAYATRNGLA